MIDHRSGENPRVSPEGAAPGAPAAGSLPAGSCGLNLMRFGPLRAMIRWRGFPWVFQALVLGIFIVLAWIGWGRFTPEGVNAKLYAKANLVNLVIWGLWWPAMVWVAVLLGRVWCTVCPLELVTGIFERAGRALGFRQRPVGGWLARGALAVGLFAILQLLVPGVQIHRVPHYTAIFLLVLLAGAVAAGLLWKDRAFCRVICPVSLLLNAYGRGGMIAVRGDAGASDAGCCCAAGADGEKNGRLDAHACPSRLNPPKLASNKDCLVCGQCLKACGDDRMRLLLRGPFTRADDREPMASWPLTLFVMVVSGFVIYELCGVWKAAESVFLWAPKQAGAALNAGNAAGWIQGLWTILLVPVVLWLVLGGCTRLLGGARTLGEACRRLALPMAVVVASGHMAKGLEKFTSWAGFLPGALTDPGGVDTALGIAAKTIVAPAAWLSPQALSASAALLVGLSIPLALREARLAESRNFLARAVPVAAFGAFLLFLVLGWA